jgi:hypothetical protein
MAAAPDDDARTTLAELEAKLRELERELLHGPPAPPPELSEIPGFEAAARPPLPAGQAALFAGTLEEAVAPAPEEPAPPAVDLDDDALREARDLLGGLRETIDALSVAAERIGVQARAVVDDHGRTLARLERAASAAGRAEEAAVQAGRVAGTAVVEAGPFAQAGAVSALRDALAAQPGARDAYVRRVEGGRAVIEVRLHVP